MFLLGMQHSAAKIIPLNISRAKKFIIVNVIFTLHHNI